MEMREPFIITPRLLPGLRIGGAFVALEYCDARDNARQGYQWHIDLADGREFSGDDLASGCGGGSLQSGFESLLSFLGAFAESVGYQTRTGHPGENADLFPAGLAEWATQNSDEFYLIATELEETPDLITE